MKTLIKPSKTLAGCKIDSWFRIQTKIFKLVKQIVHKWADELY